MDEPDVSGIISRQSILQPATDGDWQSGHFSDDDGLGRIREIQEEKKEKQKFKALKEIDGDGVEKVCHFRTLLCDKNFKILLTAKKGKNPN